MFFFGILSNFLQNFWRWQTAVECISNGTFSWENVFSTLIVKSFLAKNQQVRNLEKKRENEEKDYSEKTTLSSIRKAPLPK